MFSGNRDKHSGQEGQKIEANNLHSEVSGKFFARSDAKPRLEKPTGIGISLAKGGMGWEAGNEELYQETDASQTCSECCCGWWKVNAPFGGSTLQRHFTGNVPF